MPDRTQPPPRRRPQLTSPIKRLCAPPFFCVAAAPFSSSFFCRGALTQGEIRPRPRQSDDWKGHQIVADLNISARLENCKKKLETVKSKGFIDSIQGSLGVDPALFAVTGNNYKAP